MLESNPPDAAAAAVKRYAPPSQRNRSLNRRKSAEKFEKVNYPHGIEGEKGQGSYSRNFSAMDRGEAGNYYIQNVTPHSGLIPLNGCSISEASQLLNELSAFRNVDCNTEVRDSPEVIGTHALQRKIFQELSSFEVYLLLALKPFSNLFLGWMAALNSCNDPSIDLSEKPILYSGASGSSWGYLKLPHQMDFLGELRRAVQNAPVNAMPTAGERS